MYHLTVVQDFGNYTKGQRIEAQDEVEMILAGPYHNHVVKTLAPANDQEAPASAFEPD